MRMGRQIRRFQRDREGSSMLEFALIAPILFGVIFAIIEIGLITLSIATLESATNMVTRTARLGPVSAQGGQSLEDSIRQAIQERSAGLLDPARVLITTDINDEYGDLTQGADVCLLQDPPPAGTCPGAPGVAFEDLDNDGVFDPPAPEFDLGGPGDLIEIEVLYPYPVLTPFLASALGGSGGELIITTGTLIKNESY